MLCCTTLIAAPSCSADFKSYRPIQDVNNLEGRKVGATLGWASDYILTEREGKDLLLYRYDTVADMLMALCYHQIDAMALDYTNWKLVNSMQPGLKIVEEPIQQVNYLHYVSGKRPDVYKKLNAFIEESLKDGTCENLQNELKLFDGDNYEWPKGLKSTGTGDTLRVACMMDGYPYDFVEPDGSVAGYEVEFMTRFANEYNYRLEIVPTSEDDLYMGVATGLYDISMAAIADVYAREAESMGVYATTPYFHEGLYLVEIDDPSKLTQGEELGM